MRAASPMVDVLKHLCTLACAWLSSQASRYPRMVPAMADLGSSGHTYHGTCSHAHESSDINRCGLCVQVVVIAAGYCTRAYRLKTGSTQVRDPHTSHHPGHLTTETRGMTCASLLPASEGCKPQSYALRAVGYISWSFSDEA